METKKTILAAVLIVTLFVQLAHTSLSGSSEELAFSGPPLDAECTYELTANEVRGVLVSPGFPNGYPNSAHCRWNIAASYGNITLVVKKFNVEWSIDCEYDHLKITIGKSNKLLGRYCGSPQSASSLLDGDTIKTNSSFVSLEFISDSNFNSDGFKIEYFTDSVRNAARGTSCNRVLTAQSGLFSSPGYPVGYSANEHCETIISVEPGDVIILNFEDIVLEESKNCEGDYVEAFDGPTTDFPSLGRWCGRAKIRGITTSSNSAVVVFHSDDIFQDIGFNATYEALQPGVNVYVDGPCGVNRSDFNGTITSPNWPKKYSANQKCIINLNATESRRVEISFEYFLLEKSPDCSADFLEILDKDQKENAIDGVGTTRTKSGWRLMYRLCGDGVPQKTLASSSNEMQLKFSSDGFSEVRGFKIYYRIVTPAVEKVTEPPREEPLPTLPPESMFKDVFEGQSMFIEPGEEYVLQCLPKNINCKVTWYKDGAYINAQNVKSSISSDVEFPSEYILYIRQMSNSTVGQYTCEVNLQKKRSKMSVTLNLVEKTNTKVCNITLRPLSDVVYNSGETPYFICQARHRGPRRQPLSYDWMRNFQPLPLNDPRFRTTIGHGFYINEASLIDSGVYTCVVTDQKNQCSVRTSAVLKIIPKGNIDQVCGKPKFVSYFRKDHTDDGKIIAGSTARLGTHPWMAMLFSPKKKAFCGGALLNQQWVLTAAHCLVNFDEGISNISVILGKHDQTMAEDNEVVGSIDKYFVHPNFDPSTYDSDLALIRLRSEVQFTDYIMPICLGETDFVRKTFFNYTDLRYGTVAGWGKLSERGGRPRYLQEIKLPLVHPDKCRTSTSHPVTPNMFCAGYNQDIIGDACKGDSGGSFTVEHGGRWYAIGVVSWGVGCGRAGHYGFYIKLDNYHTWIKHRIS